MATTTPNFGWPVPTSSDLVKNGATAIEGLGDAIDASLLDLKGGTTGQVLAKASGTDMDFSWVTDATGIPATIFDAKGDIIAATAADTASRLAVGTDGQTLVADSSTATGLKWATPTSGGMTLLSTTTLSGSTTNITGISGSYINLLILIENAGIQTTAGAITINFDSLTTNNFLTSFRSDSTTALNTSSGNIPLSHGQTCDTGVAGNSFAILINNYANGGSRKPLNFQGNYYSGGWKGIWGGGGYESQGALTTTQIKTSAGTFSGGTVRIYGVN